MARAKIKIPLLMIAVSSAAYWLYPPYLLGGPAMGIACLFWALLSLAAFRWDKAEDGNYRLSSFLGVALATTEGVAGILALGGRPGLLLMATLHLGAFLLALAGRFQRTGAGRPRHFS